jgi:hypothetical protein
MSEGVLNISYYSCIPFKHEAIFHGNCLFIFSSISLLPYIYYSPPLFCPLDPFIFLHFSSGNFLSLASE